MINHDLSVRVRYGETDRMGFVYYGNYATYFEVARVEMLRMLGVNYKSLEDSGFSLPVVEYKIKYLKPAFYDEVLTVKTRIETMPSVRIRFQYETFNESGIKINEAETTLVFVDTETLKPCNAPDFIYDKLRPYFVG